jgi:anti-anti-sigma factor
VKGSVELKRGPGEPTIIVSGDADLTSAPELHDALEEVATEYDRAIVDLNGATLIDSRTIGVLADCSQTLRQRGGDVIIVCNVPDILRLFRTIGLEGSFSFYPDRTAVDEGGQTSSI